MKVSRNKKTAFQNLYDVVFTLNENEKVAFSKFLKEKRRKTKANELFEYIVKCIENDESYETIIEGSVKKDFQPSLTSNFNKLTENLYNKLLVFVANQFKKDEWKKWQIEANQTLIEIEALCNRELYSQAISHLLKLEDKLKSNEIFHKWMYDDIGIYTRMANLKIHLIHWGKGIYTIDEIDSILHNLLQTGSYFYNNKLSSTNLSLFAKHKHIGYQLLSKYFYENEKYKESIEFIEHAINNTKLYYKDNPYERDLLLYYFNLYKLFLKIKNGDKDIFDSLNFKLNSENTSLITSMLHEQMIKEIRQSLSLDKPDINIDNNEDYFIDLLFYTEMIIDNIPYRLELNRAILFYFKGDCDESLKIISELKSKKHIKQRDNPLFLDLLFLELLCKIENNEPEISSLIRNIGLIINKKQNFEFENTALKLLDELSTLSNYGKQQFKIKKSENIVQLKSKMSKINIMHNIILKTLMNEIIKTN